MTSDERQILELFKHGDQALIEPNIVELERIYAHDYLQYDESGTACDRKELIRRLTSGEIRFVSMKSTGRRIQMIGNETAVVHGSEEDEIEQSGRRFHVNYLYMDVVIKRNRRWQIVASQLVKPRET